MTYWSYCFRPLLQFFARWVRFFPFVAIELLFLVLIVFGIVGSDYGLFDLFWNENRYIQFGSGFFVGFLYLTIWSMCFILDSDRRDQALLCNGFFALRDSKSLWDGSFFIKTIRSIISIINSGYLREMKGKVPVQQVEWVLSYFNAAYLPFATLMSIPFLLPSFHAPDRPITFAHLWKNAAFPLGIWLALPVYIVLALHTAWSLVLLQQMVGVLRTLNEKVEASSPDASGNVIYEYLISRKNFAILVTIILLTYVIFENIFFYSDTRALLPASLTICYLLAWAALVWFATYGKTGTRIVMVLILPFIMGFTNGRDPYKLMFPGLEEYYASDPKIEVTIGKSNVRPGSVRDPCPLDNIAVLKSWRRTFRETTGTQAKPKLVVVAVSGGGIVAATWTALCLTEIERRYPYFPCHVRLITGASGGMVGAGYYVTTLFRVPVGKRDDSLRTKIVKAISSDSLTPTLNHMVLSDLPRVFLSCRQRWDRGRILELQWEKDTEGALAATFASFHGTEAKGAIPSLIISPTLIEFGSPLLISNLNLSFLKGNPEFFKLFPAATGFKLNTVQRRMTIASRNSFWG